MDVKPECELLNMYAPQYIQGDKTQTQVTHMQSPFTKVLSWTLSMKQIPYPVSIKWLKFYINWTRQESEIWVSWTVQIL